MMQVTPARVITISTAKFSVGFPAGIMVIELNVYYNRLIFKIYLFIFDTAFPIVCSKFI